MIAYRRKMSFCCRQKKISPLIFYSINLEYMILLICCWNISNVHGFAQSHVSYVDECRADCVRLKDPLTCGKLRIVRWLHNLTVTKDINYGSLRFVRLSSTEAESILPELPTHRGFSAYSKFFNFVRSSVDDLLTRRALVYSIEQHLSARSLSTGPAILDTDEFNEFLEIGRSAEGRGIHKKKKKLSIVLPFLILLKLFKLKLLMIPILIGVHFIKKILLLGAFALSSILSNLKYCKIPPMTQHPVAYSTWATAAEAPIDFSGASGHEDDGWSQKIDTVGYDPHVANVQRNPYRAYYQALKQQQQQHHNAI